MNAPLVSTPRVEAFFFDADPGTRFSLYHAPDPNCPERGAILYVHPFAEELNRTRRMAQLQARRFAALGGERCQCPGLCQQFVNAEAHFGSMPLPGPMSLARR